MSKLRAPRGNLALFAPAESPEEALVPSYENQVTRDRRWWLIHIPALDGVTQARHAWKIEVMACDFIAVSLNISIEDVRGEAVVLKRAARGVRPVDTLCSGYAGTHNLTGSE